MVVVAIVALLSGATAAVWLAGNLAAVPRGRGGLGVGPAVAAGVLARLPDTLDDPGRAWPATVRDELPGNITITVALILSPLVVMAVLMVVLWGLLRLQRPKRPADSAEWATSRDLRELHVSGPQRRRLVLGRQANQLLAAEPRASVMVVAPAQSGKTTGLAVPSILEWDGPVLATSIKGDLAHDTIAARPNKGTSTSLPPTQRLTASDALMAVRAPVTLQLARRVVPRGQPISLTARLRAGRREETQRPGTLRIRQRSNWRPIRQPRFNAARGGHDSAHIRLRLNTPVTFRFRPSIRAQASLRYTRGVSQARVLHVTP